MRRRDINRLLIALAVPPVVPWVARAQTCAPRSYDRTSAETAAGAKVVDSTRCPGDWRRYGADPTGNTDSTVAIQAACKANKLAFDAPGGTYRVSAQITIPSGVTVRGAGTSATQIVCVNGGISIFATSGATGTKVENIKFTVTAVSKEAYTAAVNFHKSINCSCND